jgi:hypothetical protein
MRTALLSATCLLFLCASAFAGPLTKVERQELASYQDLYVFGEDLWKSEDDRIARENSNVVKGKNSLTLKLANGGEKRLTYEPCADEPGVAPKTGSCSTYLFLAHIKSQGGYFVSQAHWEWVTVHWIDEATGEETKFANVPQISPDGTHALLIDNELMNGENLGKGLLYERQGPGWVQTRVFKVGTDSEQDNAAIINGMVLSSWIGRKIAITRKSDGKIFEFEY